MTHMEESMMFNLMSDYYDKYRPGYPKEIISSIITTAKLDINSQVLEIGSGSGKATMQFADYGFKMICLDPGRDLIEKAREKFKNKNISFITSRFEDYEFSPNYFDAIISAQAFHWISKPKGLELCSKALKPQGYLMPFWNIEIIYNTDLDNELYSIMDKYNAFTATMKIDDYKKRVERISNELTYNNLFMPPEVVQVPWKKTYTADEYFGYVMTGNVFIQNSDDVKLECYNALKELEVKYNGIKRNYICELYMAKNNK